MAVGLGDVQSLTLLPKASALPCPEAWFANVCPPVPAGSPDPCYHPRKGGRSIRSCTRCRVSPRGGGVLQTQAGPWGLPFPVCSACPSGTRVGSGQCAWHGTQQAWNPVGASGAADPVSGPLGLPHPLPARPCVLQCTETVSCPVPT